MKRTPKYVGLDVHQATTTRSGRRSVCSHLSSGATTIVSEPFIEDPTERFDA
jgi:hypothetical protein